MKTWKLHVLMNDGFPVKVYVNAENSQAVVFPLFGKYYVLRSDVNVMDLATTLIVAKHGNVVSFAAYQTRDEDTAIIHLDQLAA